MPVCDGCGEQAGEQHIRQRIERLELATRFRPIHIAVLLIDAAPPMPPGDFFYATGDAARSQAGQAYFDELAKLAGAAAGAPEEAVSAEFQRRGFFLTSAVECPVTDGADLNSLIRGLAPTVLRRVQASYKPKQIALISPSTKELIEPFHTAGWDDRLILDGGNPFSSASIGGRLAAGVRAAN